jgi:hypothetical protein
MWCKVLVLPGLQRSRDGKEEEKLLEVGEWGKKERAGKLKKRKRDSKFSCRHDVEGRVLVPNS